MPKTNLSLGNLYRATVGSARTTQASSLNTRNGSAGTQVSLGSFAIDSVTANLPTFTYIVESTTEAATFTFGSAGAVHGTRVGSVAANYTVSFNNANFTVGTATLGASPSFPITPTALASSTYLDASASLSMTYADGFNTAATGYNSTSTKLLYAVDVYNTINQPDFCLLFGSKVQRPDGTEISVEDLSVGDIIKAWVPVGLPDEDLDPESEQVDWKLYKSQQLSGSYQEVTVSDLTFNFAVGYYSVNNGLIKSTGTHPLWVWDSEIEQYRFKNVEDLINGDKLVRYYEMIGTEEVEITNIEAIVEDVEIVTINVEDADVYLTNGIVSHNKGTTTQPYIVANGLRMYLDPSKTASFASGALPSTGTPTVDWLDLSGYNTGLRPAGVTNAAGISGANPTYNNGASRKERYWGVDPNKFWYKDGTTNINGGYTQFNTSAYSVIAWVRFPFHPASTWHNFFNKQDGATSASRIISLYLNSNGSGTYFIHDGTTIQYNSSTFTLSTNVWYMVSYTATLNGTNVGYLDKTSRGTISNGAKNYTTSGLITVGYNFQEGNYAFTGHIGPVLFYNRQLSETEIGQVYDYFSPSYK
jgi:hypothetical protein